MIEQALAIATSDGGTTQATIQIPSTYSLEGNHLQVGNQRVSIDKDGQITVHNVGLSGLICIYILLFVIHHIEKENEIFHL